MLRITPKALLAFALAWATLTPGLGHAAEVAKGGTLTYSFTPEPTALSTIATTAVPTALASTKIFESLLTYAGPALDPKPGLAESWSISPDQLSYTFKLRPGVKWHDGQPFTSADVKFSIEKIVKPMHPRGNIYFKHLVAVEAPDALTAVFKLDKAVPFFLKAFQPTEAPMFPEHILGKTDLATFRQSDFMRQPIGTGPFMLKEWKKGSYLILERNPNYWNPGHPYLDRIVMRVIPDDNAKVAALESGEIDLAPMNTIAGATLQLLAKRKDLVISHDGSEGLGPVMGLLVNLREKPLSELKVREAISLGLDRKKIASIIFYGQGEPANNPIVHANPVYYDKSLAPYEFDPAKANKLLDEAGYPRGADKMRFKIRLAGLPYGSAYDRLAEYVKLALGNVGIEVTLVNQDMASWLKQVYTDWDYDLANAFLHDYSDPSIVFEQEFTTAAIKKGGTFNNNMDYRNPKLDEILEQASGESDVAKRQKLYFEAERILHHDMPEIFLLDQYYTNVWNKRVHGLITNGISMYSSWDSVWVEK
ncbi:MAG: ABC transporter substrate-binding protein [Alphaproteobacteria bacterium]